MLLNNIELLAVWRMIAAIISPKEKKVSVLKSVIPADSCELVRSFLHAYQCQLCDFFEAEENTACFRQDKWQRDGLGSGLTCVLEGGQVFEQVGVNFSEVSGSQPPAVLLGKKPALAGQPFWGAGVSMVAHPVNPFCPTVHLNYRYFQTAEHYWFGGGCDLTPYYIFQDDARHWHQTIKNTMDKHHPSYYPAFKYWCDEYFYNHHRAESRGIGGSFYDDQHGAAGCLLKSDSACKTQENNPDYAKLQIGERSWQDLWQWHQDNALSFFAAYTPILAKRKGMAYTPAQREHQLYRRGRYVEFNLLHDRGTHFGLQSGGRVESILMSLPPQVKWGYDKRPEPGSPEAILLDFLVKHRRWCED